MRDISGQLFQIKSLFNIAYKSGFVSEMNYQVIDQELVKLLDFLTEYNANQLSVESDLFGEEFFNKELPRGTMENEEKALKDRVLEQTDSFSVNKNDLNNIGQPNSSIGHDFYKGQKDKNKRTAESPKLSYTKKTKKNNARRDKIMDIIKKKKKKVSVKDVSAEISGVSEKTLQRELLAMVKDGIIQKEGERRWSRYFL
jgi:hypothetical protein